MLQVRAGGADGNRSEGTVDWSASDNLPSMFDLPFGEGKVIEGEMGGPLMDVIESLGPLVRFHRVILGGAR